MMRYKRPSRIVAGLALILSTVLVVLTTQTDDPLAVSGAVLTVPVVLFIRPEPGWRVYWTVFASALGVVLLLWDRSYRTTTFAALSLLVAFVGYLVASRYLALHNPVVAAYRITNLLEVPLYILSGFLAGSAFQLLQRSKGLQDVWCMVVTTALYALVGISQITDTNTYDTASDRHFIFFLTFLLWVTLGSGAVLSIFAHSCRDVLSDIRT